MKTTSVALGSYFENFIATTIETGRYNNASEVVCACLRMLEKNEKRICELSTAIFEGEESGSSKLHTPMAKYHLTKKAVQDFYDITL